MGLRQDGERGDKTPVKAIFSEPDAEKALILDSVKDLVIYHDPDMRITWANREAGASVESDPRDLRGRDCWEVWHGRKEPCPGCPVVLALETGEPRMAEISSPDGREWFIRGYPVRNRNGKLVGVAEFCLDITERKRAERAMDRYRESEMRIRRIADNMADVIAQTDVCGVIQYISPSVKSIIGYTAEEIIGKKIFDLHHEDDVELTMARFRGLIDGKQGGFVEFRHRQAAGSYIWVESIGTRLTDGTGRPTGAIISCRDITERKRIETKIRESEEKFRVLAETTSCAIAILRDSRIIYVNPAAVSMFGFTKDELLSMSIEDVASHGDQEGSGIIRSAYEQFYTTPSLPQKAEIRMRRKDGKAIWIEVSVGRIDYDGKPAMLVNVFEITERKTAQEELSRVRDELEFRVHERTAELRRSNEALREEILERRQAEIALTETKMQAELYVDLMGHDINNLNQIAAGYLELALETVEMPESQRELLGKPLEALMNSSRLINNVRKLQRVKTRKGHLELIDLRRVLEEAYDQYSGIADASIMVDCGAIRNARVMANELLSDVFSNLICNAIKHSHNMPVISVRLAEELTGGKKFYVAAVEDNGPGVPDEYKQIIFNRQQRGQTKAPGSGIGLHLVKTLVDEYGGDVWVEDRIPGEVGQGSRFVVVLPAAE